MYEAILRQDPEQFDALHLLGVIAIQQGNLATAQERIEAALAVDPGNAGALGNLAAVHLRGGRFERALDVANQALQRDPESVDALINAGTAFFELKRFGEGIAPLRRASALAPRSAQIWNLLGACFIESGDAPNAVEAFDSATLQAPEDATGWANLATALNAISEHHRALECAERAVALRSDSASTLGSQATALFELGKIDEAIAVYRRAVQHSPSVEVYCAFAHALLTSGLNEEAIGYLLRAIELDTDNAYARWIMAIAHLKPVYKEASEIEDSRARFGMALTDLKSWFEQSARPYAYSAVGASQPFFIAYQEYNNRALLKQFGDVCVTWMSQFSHSDIPAKMGIPRNAKMRIGFASAHIRDHSVWNAITKGWAYGLDRNRFEIFLFQLNPVRDIETARAKEHFDYFEDHEKTLAGWVSSIKGANLDFLIYPELGMDSLTYQLAAQRLAPLQAVSWGHPETSGVPTIDFYFSGNALEPPDAQENYSEKLVRLPNLGICIDQLRPKAQDPNFKSLGLPNNEPLLLCPGAPFKYLPMHDRVWVEIAKGLQAQRTGRLVFFSGTSAMYLNLISRLRKSFQSAGVEFNDRVCIVPLLDRARFFGLMQRSALLLDTLGFSGINTALQALECGLPVLAYEGRFLRGRLASGVMRTAGFPELVATSHEDYIERAVRLSADKAFLKKVRGEIPLRRENLFMDATPVQALGRFLESEITKLRATTSTS